MAMSYAEDYFYDWPVPDDKTAYVLHTNNSPGEQTVGLMMDEDYITETVDAVRSTRQRQGHAKHPSASSSSSSPSSAAAATGDSARKTKNAMMLLNELKPGGLICDAVIKSGPDHKPVYTASITIYGQTFKGVGRTKKQAKQFAAQTALQSCVQFQHPEHVQRYTDANERRRHGVLTPEDFTLDNADDVQHDFNFNRLNKSLILNCPNKWTNKFQSESHRLLLWTSKSGLCGLKNGLNPSDLNLPFKHIERSSMLNFPGAGNEKFQSKDFRYSSWSHQLDKEPLNGWSALSDIYEVLPDRAPSSSSGQRRWWNPAAILSDLRPNIQYHRTSASDMQDEDRGQDSTKVHSSRRDPVTVTAVVDGQRFYGHGRTTKQAKRRLSADVLRTLFHFQFIGQKPRLAYH